MPPRLSLGAIRRAVLDKVFKQGVESVPKEALEDLFKSAKSPMVRYHHHPEKLMKEGWKPQGYPFDSTELEKWLYHNYSLENIREMQRTRTLPKLPPEMHGGFDEPGLYWYQGQQTSNRLPSGDIPAWSGASADKPILGLRRPKAKIASTPDMDFMDPDPSIPLPDTDFHYRYGTEMIQKKPNQVLAKFGDLFKIIGLGALMNRMAPEENDDRPNR